MAFELPKTPSQLPFPNRIDLLEHNLRSALKSQSDAIGLMSSKSYTMKVVTVTADANLSVRTVVEYGALTAPVTAVLPAASPGDWILISGPPNANVFNVTLDAGTNGSTILGESTFALVAPYWSTFLLMGSEWRLY
jgi:hypothetical protein